MECGEVRRSNVTRKWSFHQSSNVSGRFCGGRRSKLPQEQSSDAQVCLVSETESGMWRGSLSRWTRDGASTSLAITPDMSEQSCRRLQNRHRCRVSMLRKLKKTCSKFRDSQETHNVASTMRAQLSQSLLHNLC